MKTIYKLESELEGKLDEKEYETLEEAKDAAFDISVIRGISVPITKYSEKYPDGEFLGWYRDFM